MPPGQGWQVADDSREGVRVSFPQGEGAGWFLLRLSVHDPVMPLNVESDVPGGCRIIAQKLRTYLEGPGGPGAGGPDRLFAVTGR